MKSQTARVTGWLIVVWLNGWASTVEAQGALPGLRVTEVLGATSDVRDLLVQGDRVAVGTSGGLVIFREGRVAVTLTAAHGLPGTRVRSLSPADSDDGLWVSTIEGVVRLEPDSQGRLTVISSLPLRRVTRVARFAGATWFATAGHGLFRLDHDPRAQPREVVVGRHVTHRHQTDLLVQGDELWVATAGAGIFCLDAQGRVRRRLRARHGLADDVVWRMLPAGNRVLVATAVGLSVLDRGRLRSQAPESVAAGELPVRDVRAVALNDGELWLGTAGGGLFRWQRGWPHPQPVGRRGQQRSRVQALAAGPAGVLVGLDQGLLVGRGGQDLEPLVLGGLPSADLTALASAFGRLWIGTFTHGLASLTDGRVVPFEGTARGGGTDRRINDLAVTGAGTPAETLWIATDRGLFSSDGHQLRPLSEAGGPGREHVTSLYVHPMTGDLWVTSSRQLLCWRAGQWLSWGGSAETPLVNLHSVTSDRSGNLWLGSLHGLWRFFPDDGTFERHAVATGALAVDWVTALVPWQGGVVAGTYHGGLSWYDGQRFRLEREEPEVGGLTRGWINPHAMLWHAGQLWLGTLEGGLLVGQAHEWSRLGLADGLPSEDVTDILPLDDHQAWIATRGGLVRVRVERPQPAVPEELSGP